MGKQRLEQKQYQNLSPQQIQFLGLLQIPIISLEKRIEEELEDNPALDEDEEKEEHQGSFYSPASKTNYEDFQIEDKSGSLQDHLVKQLIDLNLEDDILFLVNYLINSLDDNGFLRQDLYSISSDLLINNNKAVSETSLQVALKKLQDLAPIGVGARNLQDCLLIQLRKHHPSEKVAFQIVSEYYTPFGNKNFEHLIKNLNLSEKKLKSIYHLIENLNPIPAAGFSKNTTPAEYVYPDFTIIISNNQLQLQLNKSNTKTLKVSKYYSNLLLETTDSKTKKFLLQKIEKAKWFKESMKKREATLRLVMEAIVQLQKGYLISGADSDLRPMKLADVADIVNMDISTISRVSNSKFIETHFGTFKVKELFSDAFRKDNGELISTNEIKHQLNKIVLTEDKIRPFTDEELSGILGKEEYHIARRTVAKYREQLGIETAKLRREL
jgi:RNA polymerase sigma-54 factor